MTNKPYDSYSSDRSSGSNSSSDSEESEFKKEHKIETLYRPDDTKDKIIIEVVDSGIGIKKKDKKKLFKLFGCLQNTR